MTTNPPSRLSRRQVRRAANRAAVCAVVAALAATAVACTDDGDAGDTDAATQSSAPSGSSQPGEPTTLVSFPAAGPGEIVGLAADDERRVVSWLHRLDGTIHELELDRAAGDDAANSAAGTVVATIDVSTDGQQSGLLDQLFLPDGTRVLTWTVPGSNELVAGTLAVGVAEPDIFWSAGEAGSGAIGGKLDLTDDGLLLVSIGRNTAFDATDGDGGAILAFDVRQLDVGDPVALSRGYTNPWAFEALAEGEIWVWDNAAGPDPDDRDTDDLERIGRADLQPDRNQMARSDVADRAPAAMVELPDGRIGVCGFLDNELRAYEAVDTDDGPRTRLERAGTIMPCNTAATVFADGTIVTAAQTDAGESLQVLRP